MPKSISVEVVAGAALKKDGKYLLVQEKRADVYGKWNWPAGKVGEGESFEQAAAREAKEEVGLDVKIIEQIAIIHDTPAEACKHLFKAEIVGGELNWAKDEMLDAKWFTPEEILGMKDKLRSSWIWKGVEVAEKK